MRINYELRRFRVFAIAMCHGGRFFGRCVCLVWPRSAVRSGSSRALLIWTGPGCVAPALGGQRFAHEMILCGLVMFGKWAGSRMGRLDRI